MNITARSKSAEAADDKLGRFEGEEGVEDREVELFEYRVNKRYDTPKTPVAIAAIERAFRKRSVCSLFILFFLKFSMNFLGA
jgi:hypothetical protein